jgi:hypothetical protein
MAVGSTLVIILLRLAIPSNELFLKCNQNIESYMLILFI